MSVIAASGALARRPAALVALVVLGGMVAAAVAAPLIRPYDVTSPSGPPYAPPSSHHLLGTNDGGIDVLSLLIQGGRISLLIGFCAALVAGLIGGAVGLASGYRGGAVDAALMRLTDFFLVIPPVPLMIVVAAVWGRSLSHIILVIALLLWTTTARIIRAQVKSLRERTFVKRARSFGAGPWRIVARHIVPHVAPLLLANTVLMVGYAIVAETALAFLGLGDPTAVSWGSVIQQAFAGTAISDGAWWAFVPAGLCVGIVGVCSYLLGLTLEEALNPRLRTSQLAGGWSRRRPLPAEEEVAA